MFNRIHLSNQLGGRVPLEGIQECIRKIITPIERKVIPQLNCFPDGEALRELGQSSIKIPLNPPL